MTECASVLGRYAGTGPVESNVLALLQDCAGGEFEASIAPRSPLGPRAVRVQLREAPDAPSPEAWKALASVLKDQWWVDAVAPRAQHVYLRVTTGALRTWVAAGTGPVMGDEGRGRSVRVWLRERDPGSLGGRRQAAVGRSVAALLASRGFETSVVTGRPAAPDGGQLVPVDLGEVDVRHGPLRARHGGSVNADDVLEEVRGRLASAPGVAGSGDLHAEAMLAFVLLRTQRTRRVQLADETLEREASAFASLLEARAIAHTRAAEPDETGLGPVAGDGSEPAVRELATELDLLPGVAARAAETLEPALLIRFIRSVADRVQTAKTYLPATDALWPAAGEAIDVAMSLAGMEVPRGTGLATSPAGVEPEVPRPWAGRPRPRAAA
jgi:hypothetical protein